MGVGGGGVLRKLNLVHSGHLSYVRTLFFLQLTSAALCPPRKSHFVQKMAFCSRDAILFFFWNASSDETWSISDAVFSSFFRWGFDREWHLDQ